MTLDRTRGRTRARWRAVLGLTVALAAVAGTIPAPAMGFLNLTDRSVADDVDKRLGRVLPSATQKQIVANLKGTVRWNDFGTPRTLLRHGTYLSSGLSGRDAPTVARAWIRSRAALFRLTAADVDRLELVNRGQLIRTNAYAVTFRQHFGTLPAGKDGLITVAVKGTASAGWKVAYVSSTSAGSHPAPVAATLTAEQAWARAAANVGRPVLAADIRKSMKEGRGVDAWTVFPVKGFTQLQRARLVAVPIPGKGVRPAYEANVVDFGGTKTLGFTSFVDAVTGAVIVRHNRVDHLAAAHEAEETSTHETNDAFPISGEYVDAGCGEDHDFTVDAQTKSIVAVVGALITTNDIVVRIVRNPGPSETVLVSADSGTSPEVASYSSSTGIVPGNYAVRICDFVGSLAEDIQTPPYTYAGTVTIAETAINPQPYPPSWRYFQSNPRLSGVDDDIRVLRCWQARVDNDPIPNCTVPNELINLASRSPWDTLDHNTGESSFTSAGNNANTQEAWIDPPTVLFGNLGPGGYGQRPVSTSRTYSFPWTDQWRNSRCDPSVLVPGGNDIDASVTDLFALHNRMHDWTYFLGFTESNYNLQTSNFGVRTQGQGDPELGFVQAGAISGGAPLYGGRDNANQLTLQDGVPGVTNQYLFQPIGAGFYSPCVDGDLDMTIVGHEYGHAVSNRMVGGAAGGLDTDEGGAMGESWSDLMGTEIQLEHGYFPAGQNPWAAGAYATGNQVRAIRNFPLDKNPLNYSNQGYDHFGFEVHSDGEIWNAVNYDIRQALVRKYDARFPSTDMALQRRCAEGRNNQSPLSPEFCPGNRRWIQIMFDGFLLMQSDVDFLDARNAYLTADLLRFNGANQNELWKAFAGRGMGHRAQPAPVEAVEETDVVNKPDFASPVHTNSVVTFDIRSKETGAKVPNAKVIVGVFEQRTSQVADTITSGAGAATYTETARFVPGTYQFIVNAPGYGSVKFSRILDPGSATIKVVMPRNWASSASGGSIVGSTAACVPDPNDPAWSERPACLIDDKEGTDWHATHPTNVDGSSIVVKLGAKRTVGLVRVSAVLHNPGETADPASQNRFNALRSFEIWTCNGSDAVCALPTNFVKVYTSTGNIFPSQAPRPVVSSLMLQQADVTDTMATHVKLVATRNQCTGNAVFMTGFQDNDPLNSTDCRVGNLPLFPPRNRDVYTAELQVISSAQQVAGARDPLVAMTMTGPATAAAGSRNTYSISYTNAGPAAASTARIRYAIPTGATFSSASTGGTYDRATRSVVWNLGTVPVGKTGSVAATVVYAQGLTAGTTVLHRADFTAPLTIANPAFAATVIR